MPQRIRIVARELRSTASALARLESLHVVALVGGNQRPFVFFVAKYQAQPPRGIGRTTSDAGALAEEHFAGANFFQQKIARHFEKEVADEK